MQTYSFFLQQTKYVLQPEICAPRYTILSNVSVCLMHRDEIYLVERLEKKNYTWISYPLKILTCPPYIHPFMTVISFFMQPHLHAGVTQNISLNTDNCTVHFYHLQFNQKNAQYYFTVWILLLHKRIYSSLLHVSTLTCHLQGAFRS